MALVVMLVILKMISALKTDMGAALHPILPNEYSSRSQGGYRKLKSAVIDCREITTT